MDTNYADTIINMATDYCAECKRLGKHPDWTDYEFFKQKLLDRGCYGMESKLADALDL